MCLIIASPTGKKPSVEVVEDAFRSNSDGAGIAWVQDNKIFWKKGLDLQGIKDAIDAQTGPFVAHFRIASIGPKIPELTHPFPITADCDLALEGSTNAVLFQNGTYSTWTDPLLSCLIAKNLDMPPPPWSDARALAIMVHCFGQNILHLLNNSSRFAIFDARYTDKRRLSLIGDWSEQEGLYFSHKGNCAFYTPNFNRGSTNGSATTPYIRTSSSNHGPSGHVSGAGTGTNGISRPTTPTGPSKAFPLWDVFDSTGLEILTPTGHAE